MPVNTNSLRKLPANFLATQVDDELILVHGETGAFYSLKDTGLAIWHAFDVTSDIATVSRKIEQGYCVSSEDCEHAVRNFSDELVDAGFAEFH